MPAGRGQGVHPRRLGLWSLATLLTLIFGLYIPKYSTIIKGSHEKTFLQPVASVPERSHLGDFSGNLPEGDSTTEGIYINSIAPPMMRE